MNKYLELSDISLIPSDKNNGNVVNKYDFSVSDQLDSGMRSLPIFTSPMSSVVDERNWKIWADNGIKPVLPRTLPLNLRLEGCQYVFAAFSLSEVRECFVLRKQTSPNRFRICIDSGNGHDVEMFNIGKTLKQMYAQQVNLMGGNIGSPKVYLDYCHAGYDYVRVGMTSGSLVYKGSKYGFHYPQASLLIDTYGIKKTAIGLKHPKIIADGGIHGPVDILKCIALGADYVMIGRDFAKLIEAAGQIYKKVGVLPNGHDEVKKVMPEEIKDKSLAELIQMKLIRIYYGNTSLEMQALRQGFNDVHDWMNMSTFKKNQSDARKDTLNVDNTLKDWLENFYECAAYGFTMSGALSWETFKSNVKYVRV